MGNLPSEVTPERPLQAFVVLFVTPLPQQYHPWTDRTEGITSRPIQLLITTGYTPAAEAPLCSTVMSNSSYKLLQPHSLNYQNYYFLRLCK